MVTFVREQLLTFANCSERTFILRYMCDKWHMGWWNVYDFKGPCVAVMCLCDTDTVALFLCDFCTGNTTAEEVVHLIVRCLC